MHRKNKLSNEHLFEALQIFKEKNWPIEDNEMDQFTLFNRYCERLAKINKVKERNLVLELTRNFLRVEANEYVSLLKKLLLACFSSADGLKDEKTVLVAPMYTEKTWGNIKSSGFMLYLMYDSGVKELDDIVLSNVKFKISKNINMLKSFAYDNSSKILLLDDFIGSGNSALECIKFLESIGIEKKRIIIGGLVVQKMGLETIEEYGVNVFYSILRNRGISDRYNDADLEEKLNLMKSIELKLGIPNDFQFGYKKTEALVSMIRTPNNTFPVFWYEKGENDLAPFVRSKYE